MKAITCQCTFGCGFYLCLNTSYFGGIAPSWQNKRCLLPKSVMHTGRRDHENHEHRDFGEKHARSMRCTERGMWQKTREIARYDEKDEPEQGNKGMERHGDIMESSKQGV